MFQRLWQEILTKLQTETVHRFKQSFIIFERIKTHLLSQKAEGFIM